MEEIESDIVKQKQLRDAQKNAPKDKAIKATDKAHKAGNITDREHIENLKNAPNLIDRQLVGTQILNNIEYGVTGSVNWLKKQAEEDPDRYTDDMLRLLGGGIKNVSWALSKLPLIDKIAQGEDWLAKQARGMSAELTPWLDPRFAGWGTRVATGLIADKGISKATGAVTKGVKAYKAVSQADEIVRARRMQLATDLQMNINRGMDDVPQLARMFFARSGLRDGVFDLDTWRKAGSDRNVMELFQTRWDQVAYRQTPGKQFISTRKRLIGPFLEEYDSYLKRFNIDPSTVELHHIFGVNLSAPLYDGLQYGSKEWIEMTDELNRLGVFPGAPTPKGGTFEAAKKSNLMLALEEPHDLLHHQFFKDTIGVKGEKFFTPEKMDLLRSGQAGRLQVAKEYAKIIKQGETLIQRGMDQIQNVFGLTDIPPERLADAFSESLSDGTTNIFKKGYTIKSVNKVIKDLVFDIQIEDIVNPLKPQLDPKASKALILALRSPNPISSVKALKQSKYGKQLELVFDQIPENKLRQLRNIRRGKSIRLDEQTGMRPDD